MAASPAHTSGANSVGHMGAFACALCNPWRHQLHALPRSASATVSSPAWSEHLRATKCPATSSRQRRSVLVEPPLCILHLLRADGREALVLQRKILAGVTKIRTFLDYKWLNSTCLLFLAPKWSQPLLPSENTGGHQAGQLVPRANSTSFRHSRHKRGHGMVYGVLGHKSLLQHERDPGTHTLGMPRPLSHCSQSPSVFLPIFLLTPSLPAAPPCHKTLATSSWPWSG